MTAPVLQLSHSKLTSSPVVLLTDPPLRAAQIKRGVPDILIKPAPLQGGYVDFIPHDVQSRMPFGPPRSSMMDDISFYLTHHAATFHFDTPDAVKLMVMKIVASHYMQHVEFINGIVSHAQWTMSRHDSIASLSVSNVEAQWSDAQALGRRVNEYCEDLEWIMLQCRIPLECPDTSRAVPAASSWQDATVDYQFLHMRYSSIRTRAESLNSSMAALVGMAGNQHSLSEAKRTRALTILGLMFIPLAYVSSLFSMADDYLPGQARFWLYFAVSLPLIFIVFALYALVDVGMLNIVTLIGELVRRNKT